MTPTYRSIVLRGATAEIRTATFEEREHVVVPVVALVEGVLHAMNSPFPELVLASEFGIAPAGWNGRPVMPDHPIRNGQPVSANAPDVLESECIGRVFNARVEATKLLMEAWIDVERAKKSDKGVSILERIEKGEMLEISVGALVISEEGRGVHNGVRYMAVWRNIVPDHLALLSEGTLGACSNAMGCGTPRAAIHNQLTATGVIIVAADNKNEERKQKDMSLRERLRSMMKSILGTAAADDMGDGEVRSRLWDALYATEAAFAGIDEVFSETKMVVYAVAPDGNYTLYRRSFSVADDGAVTLAGEREEVHAVRRYEPVAAEGAQPITAESGCGCQKGKEPKTMTKQERIAALLASSKNTMTKDTHGAFLEALSDDQLKAIEEAEAKLVEPKKVEDPPKPEPVPAVAAAAPKTDAPAPKTEPITVESYIAAAPPEVGRILSRGLEREKAQKRELVTRLKASKKNPFSEAELETKTVEELEKLATLAGVEVVNDGETSFVGRGLSRKPETRANAGGNDGVDAPPDMTAAIKSARSAS